MAEGQTLTDQMKMSNEFLAQVASRKDGEPALACMQCGMCSGSCPLGYAMEYPPRKIILQARAGNLDKVLASPSTWMCIGCYTCSLRCPRGIELTEVLWPMLRDKAMQTDYQPPAELQETFQNIYKYGNSLGQSPRQRMKWADGLDVVDVTQDKQPVDVLVMMGDYPAYYPRNQVVAQGFAKILAALEVNWGVLGRSEKALGECDGLMGEEGLFETLVEDNVKTLGDVEFGKMVLLDPHGFRAVQKFYPRFGAEYDAEHYTTFLADRLEQLKPLLKNPVEAQVTYHDNCCAGRRCESFDAPRDLLQAIPGVELVEMPRNRENSLCCGGGGGGMWLDAHITEHGGHRLSDERVQEAAGTGAGTLAVSCPYELSRFEDAAKVTGLEGKLEVRDIIELLTQSMGLA